MRPPGTAASRLARGRFIATGYSMSERGRHRVAVESARPRNPPRARRAHALPARGREADPRGGLRRTRARARAARRRACDRAGSPRPPAARPRLVSRAVLERLADSKTPQHLLAIARRRDVPVAEILGRPGPRRLSLRPPGPGQPRRRRARRRGGRRARASPRPPGSADFFHPRAVRASAGSVLRIPVSGRVSFEPFARDAKEAGRVICGAVPSGGDDPFRAPPPADSVLVIGSEGAGLPAGAYRYLDRRLTIPMAPPVDSLNAAVAAALLLYAARRRGFRRRPRPETSRRARRGSRQASARKAGLAAGLLRGTAPARSPTPSPPAAGAGRASRALRRSARRARSRRRPGPRPARGADSTEISISHRGSSSRSSGGNRGSSNAARRANSATTRVRSPSGESVPMQPRSWPGERQRHEEAARLPEGLGAVGGQTRRRLAPEVRRERARARAEQVAPRLVRERRGPSLIRPPRRTAMRARKLANRRLELVELARRRSDPPSGISTTLLRVAHESFARASGGPKASRDPRRRRAPGPRAGAGRGPTPSRAAARRRRRPPLGRASPRSRAAPRPSRTRSRRPRSGKPAAPLGLRQRRAKVRDLSPARVVAPGRQADAAEIEAQRSVSARASAPARRGRRPCCAESRRAAGCGCAKTAEPDAAPSAGSFQRPSSGPSGPRTSTTSITAVSTVSSASARWRNSPLIVSFCGRRGPRGSQENP